MELKREIAALNNELIRLRRDFHRNPELGFAEYRTSEIIYNYLKDCGLDVKKIAGTGVVGLLKGSEEGKILLLRSDMDALPITEENRDISYCSVNDGVMHACGHDGHMAMLLIAAKILAERAEELKGAIKFVFQPNEEDAGAYLMVEEGVLEDPPVDAAASCHLWSGLESGQIDICEGPVMAASHYFYLNITGKGGHAGHVSASIDPIMASASVIQAVASMQTRAIDAFQPTAIVFTGIEAGCNPTTVPESARLKGSIRFLAEDGTYIKERFAQVIEHTCAAHGAGYDLKFKIGNEVVINNPQMTELARKAALDCLFDDTKLRAEHRSLGGEDFSEFSSRVPAVFYFIGSGNRSKKTDLAHHHPCFDLDEEVLPLGVEMYLRVALRYFGLTE